MKQLKSFMVMNVSGMNRVTATYDVIDESGMPVSRNSKLSFYAVEKELNQSIEEIQAMLLAKLED